MRVLVTNDDGVHAPGLASVARALGNWASEGSPTESREVVVAAPLANHSGASAAVGTVYEREAIAYRAVELPGAEDVPAYGLDASPALSVIIAMLGGFGPRPDLVVSGINLGVNVGRSILHSGTVGAALTGAHFGASAVAASMRSGVEPAPWEAAATIVVHLLPVLSSAPARSVLNLNVPPLPLDELRGIRQGHIGGAGIIRSARASDLATMTPPEPQRSSRVTGGPASGGGEEGEIRLQLGAAVPQLGEISGEDPEDDASLVAAGFASLTPLRGVGEAVGRDAADLIKNALAGAELALVGT